MSNLLTVCNLCHTPKNHKPGGKLYGLKRKVSNMASTAFMNSVKYDIYHKTSLFCDNVHITYGTITKHIRVIRNIDKTHADDAFCIGKFHPRHRARTQYFEKRRRNNRILSKFYDAKYMDSRDGSIKSGTQLSCGRTNRNHNRDTENLHQYRQCKTAKGRFSIRKQHYSIQLNDMVLYQGKRYFCKGCHCNGKRVLLQDGQSVTIQKVTIIKHAGSWKPVLS